MKETILNRVPHPVYILGENNEVIKTFHKSNGMARVAQITKSVGEIGGIPITNTVFGKADKLPTHKKGVYYIVSNLVKTALPERVDLLTPSNMVRDDTGMIIGCRSLDL